MTGLHSQETGMFKVQTSLAQLSPNTVWEKLGLRQVNSNQMPLAGRLKHFVTNWELVTKDPWVLSAISGYQICFTEHPYQNTQPNMTFSVKDQELINKELEDLIKKTSNSVCTIKSGYRLRQHNFCDPQKRWGAKTSVQPEAFKSVCQVRPFQNGGHTYAERPPKAKRFFSKNRSKGCLFYGANMEESPKVSSVYLARHPMGVSVSTVWLSQRTTRLYKNPKTSSGFVTKTGHSVNYLSRRYIVNGSYSRRTNSAHNTDCIFPRTVGVCNKLHKVSTESSAINRISGFSYKFSHFSNQPFKRQGKKYQTRMFKSFSKSINNSPRVSKATRQTKCLNSSSIPRTAALSISPSSQKTKLGQTRELRSPSNLVTSSSKRTEMVARSSSSMEWESSIERASHPDHRNRCINYGLGSLLRTSSNPRPLISNRKTAAHKLFRTPGRGVCPQVLFKKQVRYSNAIADGQHIGHQLHKQNGGLNFTSLIQPRLRPLAMVPRKINHSHGTAFTRVSKCHFR